jgi:hypothetical protein
MTNTKNTKPHRSRLDEVRWVPTATLAQRIVIELEGGLVQQVYADGVPATYFVVDRDVEGADGEDVTTARHDGQESSACLHASEALPLSSAPPDVCQLLSHDYPADFSQPPQEPRRKRP